MNLEPNKQRLAYGVATIALVIAIAALWLPTSWQAAADPQGKWVAPQESVTHIRLGVLKPLRLTWESGPNGFWFAFSAIQVFPLFLSVTLTVAAAIVAWRTYRRASITSGGSGHRTENYS